MQSTHEKNIFLFAIGILCVLGCGQPEPSSSPTSVITGVVSYQGSPLAKGKIMFRHQSGKTVSADIQSDGTYRLEAIRGKNKVAISSRSPPRENPQGRPRTIPGKSLIPPILGEFNKSGLTATIQSDENQLDFNL